MKPADVNDPEFRQRSTKRSGARGINRPDTHIAGLEDQAEFAGDGFWC